MFIVFIVILILKITGDHLTGPNFKGNLMPLVPKSWAEIRTNFISYIVFSSILTTIIYFLTKDKNNQKNN